MMNMTKGERIRYLEERVGELEKMNIFFGEVRDDEFKFCTNKEVLELLLNYLGLDLIRMVHPSFELKQRPKISKCTFSETGGGEKRG